MKIKKLDIYDKEMLWEIFRAVIILIIWSGFLITLFSCSGDDDITLYDFTAKIETTIQDIKTDTGKIMHTRETERTLNESYSVSLMVLTNLREKYPERTEIKDVVYDGNLTIRTIKKYYNKVIVR